MVSWKIKPTPLDLRSNLLIKQWDSCETKSRGCCWVVSKLWYLHCSLLLWNWMMATFSHCPNFMFTTLREHQAFNLSLNMFPQTLDVTEFCTNNFGHFWVSQRVWTLEILRTLYEFYVFLRFWEHIIWKLCLWLFIIIIRACTMTRLRNKLAC